MKEEARGRGSNGRRVGNQLEPVEGRGSDVQRGKGGWRGSDGQKGGQEGGEGRGETMRKGGKEGGKGIGKRERKGGEGREEGRKEEEREDEKGEGALGEELETD